MKVLIAKEIFDTGNYFPKDWVYANQDIWVFYWHSIIIPLLSFFPAGYTVHAITALIGSTLILSGIWTMLSLIDVPGKIKGLTLAVFASGMSLTLTENLFGQVSYGTTVLYYCIIIYLAWTILENPRQGKTIHAAILTFLILVIVWGNPLRGIIFYVAPLLCSIFFYIAQTLYDQNLNSKYRNITKLLLCCILGTIAGAILHKATLNYILMQEGVTQLRWNSLSMIFERTPKIFRSILFILGGEPHEGRSLYTVSGLYDGFRLIIAICFVGLIPTTVTNIFKTPGNTILKFITLFAAATFSIVCLLMLTTNIYNGRYLLPAVVLVIILVIAQKFDFRSAPLFNCIRALVVIGFLSNVLVVNTSYWATYHASEAHQDDYQQYENPFELAQFLQEHGLKYGYSTYWTAGVISVLTDHRTIIRHIYLENGIPVRFKWLSTVQWYQPAAYQGETFLLLTEAQSKAVDWPALKEKYGLVPDRTLRYKDFIVFIFPENMANKMSNWSAK